MIIIKAEIYNSYDMMKANAFTMIITKAEIYNSYCKMKVDAFIMKIINKLYQNFIVWTDSDF